MLKSIAILALGVVAFSGATPVADEVVDQDHTLSRRVPGGYGRGYGRYGYGGGYGKKGGVAAMVVPVVPVKAAVMPISGKKGGYGRRDVGEIEEVQENDIHSINRRGPGYGYGGGYGSKKKGYGGGLGGYGGGLGGYGGGGYGGGGYGGGKCGKGGCGKGKGKGKGRYGREVDQVEEPHIERRELEEHIEEDVAGHVERREIDEAVQEHEIERRVPRGGYGGFGVLMGGYGYGSKKGGYGGGYGGKKGSFGGGYGKKG